MASDEGALEQLPGPWNQPPPPPQSAAHVHSNELEQLPGPWSSLTTRDQDYHGAAEAMERREHDVAQKLVVDGIKSIYTNVLKPIEVATKFDLFHR